MSWGFYDVLHTHVSLSPAQNYSKLFLLKMHADGPTDVRTEDRLLVLHGASMSVRPSVGALHLVSYSADSLG